MSSTSVYETDVLVIGAGGTGHAAAIAAAEAGAKVIMLEKHSQPGGLTALSVGSFTATQTPHQISAGIKDNPDAHFEDMALFGGAEMTSAKTSEPPKDNLALRRILVDESPTTFRWLMSLGVRFFGPMSEPPHRVPRMHNVLPNSRAYIYFLARRCAELGVQVRTGARAKSFIVEGGRVVGVVAETSSGTVRFTARRGVVLASGDYSNGSDIKARFAPEKADIQGVGQFNTGDGQAMCERLGCEILNPELVVGPNLRFVSPPDDRWLARLPPHPALTSFMAFALSRLPTWLLRPFVLSFVTTFLAPELDMLREGAILVNKEGVRFADDVSGVGYLIPRQPDQVAYLLFDDSFTRKFSAWPHFVSTAPGVAYAYVSDYRKTRPDIYYQASTIAQLAEAMNVPAAALERTIQDYNNGSRGGRPAIVTPPFVAMGPLKSWTVITDGGVAVTTEHEVVRKNGTVVPGLYAAGAAGQGGVLLDGHGHHISWAFVSGRRAGRKAALNPELPLRQENFEEV